MLLGTLTKELYTRELFDPIPCKPLLGISFAELALSLTSIEATGIDALDIEYHNYGARNACALKPEITTIINSLEQEMSGFAIEDYV
jgi:hypothetical protein